MGIIINRLNKQGVELQRPPDPIASYVPLVTVGNLIFTSGNGCRSNGKQLYTGKVGYDLTIEQGQQAARQSIINILSAMHASLGDLDRIIKVIKLLGFVNSAPGFSDQSLVIDGASQLLVEVFGAAGEHARSAVGVSELPMQTPVSIEMIFQIET